MSKYIEQSKVNDEIVRVLEHTDCKDEYIDRVLMAIEKIPTIEVMEYPQVEGITPTLVTTEVSEDCISKTYLEQEIENQAMTVEKDKEYWRGWNNALGKVVELIDNAPSVTTEQSSKVGEWIVDEPPLTGYGTIYICPYCKYEVEFEPTNYCPNCGAKMKG